MRIHPIKLWRRSRHEVWVSILLTLAVAYIFRGHVPLGPSDTIGLPAFLLFAWLFALDALLDWKRANALHRGINIGWFIFLCYLMPVSLYTGFTTRWWASY